MAMILIWFIKNGNEGKISRWRYKKDEEVLLPDYLAKEAIDDELAIRIDRPAVRHSVNPKANTAQTGMLKR